MKIKFTDIPADGYPFASDGVGHKPVVAKPGEVHDVIPSVAAVLIQAGKAETYAGSDEPVEPVEDPADDEDETKGGFKDPDEAKKAEEAKLAEEAEVKAKADQEAADAKAAEEAASNVTKVDSLSAVAVEAQKEGVSDKDAKTMLAEWADKNDYDVDKRKNVSAIIDSLKVLATEDDNKE